jgi:hypothetical protein
MKNLISIICIGMIFICLACNHLSNSNSKSDKDNLDSTEISNLIRDVYKWYIPNESQIYFDVIVKDSFQVGIDTSKLQRAITKLKGSNYFCSDFIINYERIGMAVDNKLKKGKYYNEINFSFQDADIWTSSQDDESDLWKILKIKNLQIIGDEASLKWYRNDDTDLGYLVKTKKENGKWRISYLEGLDYKNIVE